MSSKKFLSLSSQLLSSRIEEKMFQGMETGMRNKIGEMLKMANSCLSLHQILDGVKQSHQYLVSLRFKTIGAVRDFLQGYPRDFAVVDEMVCSTKGSKADYSKIPPLGDSPNCKTKPCLKRSVSFADPSFMTPKSVTDSRNTKVESEKTVSQTARAAFSKKSKTVEQIPDHGVRCVCDKLTMCNAAASFQESDLMQINLKCLVASYMKLVQDISKRPSTKETSSQTDITFQPDEDL